ncbi:MAG: hypothetical protein KA247_00800 [Bacteroidetes bacterium]|nr:hypothetical protein [Bacteroidota bacterium]
MFLSTSWMWTYFLNLFISLPFALLGLFFWKKGRTPLRRNAGNSFAFILLLAGFISAIAVLFFYR